MKSLRIAVEGCCHGALDNIYATLQHIEAIKNFKFDLLICCGDFQAVRNESDLNSMQVPQKYRRMESFHKYYSGEKVAPVLTVFIGGNHESSSYLWELPYGGWVCPNIYYMGYSGLIFFKGLRIGGISGIYNHRHYHLDHYEYPPFNDATIRSIYHTRKIEADKLKQIRTPVDIMFSHDWPLGIQNYGDVRNLLNKKPYFENDIQRNALGSPCNMEILQHMQPKYWFAAHLHVKFAAVVPHNAHENEGKCTQFLALDKCLPHRDFLQVLEIKEEEDHYSSGLCYDLEWLKTLNSTHSVEKKMSESEIKDVFGANFEVPLNFEQTTSIHQSNARNENPYYINPQTHAFCTKLGIINPCLLQKTRQQNENAGLRNPDEIDIDSESDHELLQEQAGEENGKQPSNNMCIESEIRTNPDEIIIDDE